MSGDRLPSIEKLTNYNWTVWKLQIQSYLEAKELWKLCSGEESEPDAPADDAGDDEAGQYAEQLAVYGVRVARVKSILLQMVSTGQLHVIAQHRLHTPKDMWNELVATFERPSLSNKLQLQTRLLDIIMKPGMSVDDYFKEMQDLTERLAALGAPVEADFQIALLLRGLSSEYDSLRVAFVAKGTVTMSELREALRTEECRMNQESGTVGATGVSVLAARGNNYGRNKGMQHSYVQSFPGACYGCGKIGHKHKSCPTNPYKPKMKAFQQHKVRKAEYQTNSDNDSDENVDNAILTALYGARVTPCVSSNVWIVDSGATKHMSPCRDIIFDYVPFRNHEPVSLGNGTVCKAVGIGRVSLNVMCDGELKHHIMSDVLYVPNLMNNFFSVTAATLKGNQVTFKNKRCTISRDGQLIATGHCANHVWYMDCPVDCSHSANRDDVCAELKSVANEDKLLLWHQRLGHVNEKRLLHTVNENLIVGVGHVEGSLPFCEACVQGKQTRKPFKTLADVQTTERLQLVHSDVCGPMSTPSLGGAKYFVSFTDDYTRCSRVYFLKRKSEVFDKFKEFEAEFTNCAGRKIKTLRTDNGGEYTSAEFEAYLKRQGIRHEVSAPHTPQQNGVSERLNRTLQEMALSQLLHAGMPRCFWADSVSTACYVRNRLPVSPLNISPYEKWYGKKPNVKYFRVFGCTAYALKPENERQKMNAKSEKMKFIGYPYGAKGYRLYDEKRRRVVVRRDVVFNEADFGDVGTQPSLVDPAENGLKTKTEQAVPVPQVHQDVAESLQPPPVLRRSSRAVNKPERLGDWTEGNELEELEFLNVATPVQMSDNSVCHCLYFHNICEPKNIDEALKMPEAVHWKQAADEEMEALKSMNTWKLVPLPEGREPIGCKWIFKVKNKPDGTIERFKARLVAKGYAQRPGIDFNETFAPVVRLNTLRALLSYAVQKGLLIHQMDVVTAFLNGDLEEEVYMEQPPGYIDKGEEDLVCCLKRALYGLKQSPRCWNTTFCEYLKELGFVQLKSDYCIFKREQPLTFIALYVDDLIVITENTEVMKRIKQDLMKRFLMKDMGPLHHILGISCIQDTENNRVGLTQEVYISKLISKFNLSDANIVSTPSDPNVTLMKNDGISKPVDKSYYQSLIGSLLCYHFTREAVANEQIKLQYCHTKDMVADILTKPLTKYRFKELRQKLGLC